MQRLIYFALASLLSTGACLHFEDTYLGDGGIAGNDASNTDGGANADASLGLTLTIESTDFRLDSGGMLNVDVSIERSMGLSGAVTVEASAASLPTGVTAPSLMIPAAATTGTLVFTAEALPTVGIAAVTLEATLDGILAMADLPLLVAGATSSFDTSFAGGSGITLPGVSEVKDIVIAPTGRILVLANESGWKVIAFTEAGVLDTAFGTNGRANLPASTNPVSLKLRPDESFLVAINNTSPVQAGIAAFTASGGVDVSFNSGVSYISTVAAMGGTTIVSDMAVASSGSIFLAGSHVGGNTGAIYIFSAAGLFTDTMQTSEITSNFKHIRLHNDTLLVGGQRKGSPPVYVMARYSLALALDTTFAGDGTFESTQVPRSYLHMDVDTTGRIAVTVIDQNNPDYITYFHDANATNVTATIGNLGTGSSNFGGEGNFTPEGNYILLVNGCSNSCQFHDSEIIALDAAVPADGTYTKDANLEFTIDDQDMDAEWSLDRLAIDEYSRIVLAGENAGTTTILRVWP